MRLVLRCGLYILHSLAALNTARIYGNFPIDFGKHPLPLVVHPCWLLPYFSKHSCRYDRHCSQLSLKGMYRTSSITFLVLWVTAAFFVRWHFLLFSYTLQLFCRSKFTNLWLVWQQSILSSPLPLLSAISGLFSQSLLIMTRLQLMIYFTRVEDDPSSFRKLNPFPYFAKTSVYQIRLTSYMSCNTYHKSL